MASPHAAGVAALAVAEYGKRDRKHGGLTLAPRRVEQSLLGRRRTRRARSRATTTTRRTRRDVQRHLRGRP